MCVYAQVVKCVVDKALTDLFFQDMYTKLCSMLSLKADGWCDAFLKVSRLMAFLFALPHTPHTPRPSPPLPELSVHVVAFWFQTEERVAKNEDDTDTKGWFVALASEGPWQGPFDTKALAEAKGRHDANFRRLLLNMCQREFNVGVGRGGGVLCVVCGV
jgi:hypothetical protein